MSEDSPVYNGSTVIVTTDDGALFSCTPYVMGGAIAPKQVRWKLIDARGLEYIGPPYDWASSSPAAVQQLVSTWWEEKKALGQAGVNVDVMRRWIVDGR